ncbi:MAG TPA: hypothetical protein VEM96_19080 [Pyrinomonadaceae bacterium]|nr:hypothetical protein [Pyrinomonadaceae bacterium]
MKTFPRFIISILFCSSLSLTAWPARAQNQEPKPSPVCQRDDALNVIHQQIEASRLIDDEVKRISVLIRAADLLWPYRQDKARAALREAFDLATRNYKEKGDEPSLQGHLIVQVADQRYRVIGAIAKRDPAWARKLSDQIREEEAKEAEEKATKDVERDARTAEKLLAAASALLTSDQPAALRFAGASLRYPPTMFLPIFLYRLAEINAAGADQFYREALTAYLSVPMERFLYLSSYPFGASGDVGEMPMYTAYGVPRNFTPRPALQRSFVETLLRRAEQMIQNPVVNPAGDRGRLSESGQMWLALTRLGPQINGSLPDLAEAARQARESMFAMLSQTDQRRVNNTVMERPQKSFDEMIEDAERQQDPAIREATLAIAVMHASANETLEHVVSAADKISDTGLRAQILSWLYFERTQKATKDKKFAEAKRLASKVDELDQRAYLYLKIAEELIKRTRNDSEARELLEEVLNAAAKAPDTEVKARALLGVAFLYTRIEANRSIAVLGDAVKVINHIASPDFSSDQAGRKIEGKAFGSYATLQTPSFNPENGFREVGKVDFEGAQNLAANFVDKSLRAMTMMALAEWCLQNSPPPRKPAKVEPKVVKP